MAAWWPGLLWCPAPIGLLVWAPDDAWALVLRPGATADSHAAPVPSPSRRGAVGESGPMHAGLVLAATMLTAATAFPGGPAQSVAPAPVPAGRVSSGPATGMENNLSGI